MTEDEKDLLLSLLLGGDEPLVFVWAGDGDPAVYATCTPFFTRQRRVLPELFDLIQKWRGQ